MPAPLSRIGLAAVSGVLLLEATLALAQTDPGFMPPGGRTLLMKVLGEAPAAEELRAVVTAEHSADDWPAALGAKAAALSETERRTLAAYLTINMPLEAAVEQVLAAADPYAALPADGRDLAWNGCQFCHSLFTSHLTQDREVAGWLAMFQSPFHREVAMTEKERETFAYYSAINMPMRVEDVPPELRF